jgi:hypothetical protein
MVCNVNLWNISHHCWPVLLDKQLLVAVKMVDMCFGVLVIVLIDIGSTKAHFLGEIRPTAGRYLHYKRKSSELWLVHILELHAEVYLKN